MFENIIIGIGFLLGGGLWIYLLIKGLGVIDEMADCIKKCIKK